MLKRFLVVFLMKIDIEWHSAGLMFLGVLRAWNLGSKHIVHKAEFINFVLDQCVH